MNPIGAKQKTPLSLINRKIVRGILIAAACLTVVLIADLVVAFGLSGESRYMRRYVISPLPPTLIHAKTLKLFTPTLGDGVCWVAYQMRPEDFETILHHGKRPWRVGFTWAQEATDEKALFRKVWPDVIGELEAYTCGGDSQDGILGTVDMVVSPDHKRALFCISDL